VHEIADGVEVERDNLREKPLDLVLKPPSLRGSGVGPERLERRLGRAGLGDDILMEVSAEDASELWKGRRRDPRQRRASGYEVNT
jgi:hypothetical protein